MSKLIKVNGPNSPYSSIPMGSMHAYGWMCSIHTGGSAWLYARHLAYRTYANDLLKINFLPFAHFPCELEAYEVSWESSVKVTEKPDLRLTHRKRELLQ